MKWINDFCLIMSTKAIVLDLLIKIEVRMEFNQSKERKPILIKFNEFYSN